MYRVLILGRDSLSTRVLYEELSSELYNVSWIEERRNDKKHLLLKRIKKHGLMKVVSQLAFLMYAKALKRRSKARVEELTSKYKNLNSYEPNSLHANVNSKESINEILKLNPELIILCGTRILNTEFLKNIRCKVVNIHAGITPKYRGVHGGYWSLVNNDASNFGATIHLVDEGIDTGKVLSYARVKPLKSDNYSTYPIFQQINAMPKLKEEIVNIRSGKIEFQEVLTDSKIWTHPTLFEYLANGVR